MPNVKCVSLGCPKNLVDTEVMLGKLTSAGYRILDERDGKTPPTLRSGLRCDSAVDIFLVNTCCFIKEAEDESRDVIRQALNWRKNNKNSKVVVSGCLAQRYNQKLNDDFKGAIDAISGVFERDRIVQICDDLIHRRDAPTGQAENAEISKLIPKECLKDDERIRITPVHYAYLRIAEGCDNRCSYCIIPSIHGPYRSKPVKDIINEASQLAKNGAVEINLIAQDTTSYGRDKTGETLVDVLNGLSSINDIRWIRLLYTHPAHFSDDLIDAISRLPKVVKYIDIPIQHISDSVLKRMGRQITETETRDLINKLRSRIKWLFLRTSVIVGFPGETEYDFKKLASFISDIGFERLGAFTYSPENGTPAQQMPDQITEKVKQARLDKIMRLQQKIAFRKNQALVGNKIAVIIDGAGKNGYIGRTYGDAPEVDGTVFVHSRSALRPGDICEVLITAIKGYDLIGKLETFQWK
ncbi:MAG: 30S ribosomal protein S12 methylthiotransferase RimO [Planctomycetes bacterium]|nr:30S ribosomal protein S12 methylthiotransferase RimO [Planctomycetota bacterium]